MNFLSMEYFTAVANKRSITKAAEELHITQQTLSAHIRSVERELGCRLIVRRNPLELTYAGEVFMRYASEFYRSYQAMWAEFGDITGNQSGVLRVGVSYTRGRAIMPDIIAAFQCKYPSICVSLSEGVNDELLGSLLDGDTDLAIANFDDPPQGIVTEDFYTEQIVMLARRDMCPPIAGDTLDSERLAAFADRPFAMGNPEDIAGRISRKMIKKAGFQPNIRAQSDNAETLIAMAAAGIGLCFVPRHMLRLALGEEQAGKMRLFGFDGDERYMIKFGYRSRPYQWTVISEFMRIAREVVGNGDGQR